MKNKSAIGKFIVNPFEKIAGAKALATGLLAVFATVVVGNLSGTAFDGVIDAHIYPHSLLYAFSVQIVSLAILVLVMFVTATIVSKTKPRFIDMAGTMAFARMPYFALAFAGFVPAFRDLGTNTFSKLPLVLCFALIALLFAGWSIYWMYKAFSVSANLKKVSHVFIFIAALLIAEVCAAVAMQYVLGNWISPNTPGQEQTDAVPGQIKDDAYNTTRSIVDLIETRDFNKIVSSFDKTTREALPPEKLQQMWAQAERQFGKFNGFEDDTKVSVKNNVITTQTTVRFSKVKLALHLTFDRSGQIEGFFVKPIIF